MQILLLFVKTKNLSEENDYIFNGHTMGSKKKNNNNKKNKNTTTSQLTHKFKNIGAVFLKQKK